jgi:protein-disulfide isomerase
LRREQAGQRPRSGRGRTAQPAWRSPTALVTIAAVVVALVVIAAINLRPGTTGGGTGSSSPGSTGGSSPGSSSGGSPAVSLSRPAAEIPAGVARDGRTLGVATARVSLEAWEDFQCPACGNYSEAIEPTIIGRYVVTGKIRYTFHDFAFLGQESVDAASAARCAGEQDEFWDYHGWLYANQNGENEGWFSTERLTAIADRIGLDRSAWQACYAGGAERQAVTAETQAGVAAKVTGTPTLALDGAIVPLSTFTSWDDLYAAIDAAVAAAGSTTPSPAPSASSASAAP